MAQKRKPGRPKQPVITPEKLREIEELYLRGETGPAIAKKFGVHHNTIYGHLERTIRPAWRELQNRSVEEQLEKIRHLRRTAWRKFDESIMMSPSMSTRPASQGVTLCSNTTSEPSVRITSSV